jgi:glycosyltransferase involved in cell wall biosynthesis
MVEAAKASFHRGKGIYMRITVLCAAHSLGDERVVCRQALSLARSGHDVLMLGRGDSGKSPPEHPRLKLVSVEPLIRGTSWQARTSRLRVLRKLYGMAIDSRPDVLVANEPDSAWVALLVRWKTGVPVHFDVHECFEELAASRLPQALSGLGRALVWKTVSQISKRCDWVTVVSPHTERQHLALRTDGRVTIIHNSPPIGLFPACDQNVPNGVTLCHEGWLDASRGLSQLIRAVAIARQSVPVRLLVVGKFGAGSDSEFESLARELNVRGSIEVTGWLPYEKVGKVDARAQIGLVTLQPSGNNYGSLSNKVYSYMACGQAVIVPAASATAELVESCDCGLAVDVTRPEEIAGAIVRLCADADLRRRLGQNGRQAIEQRLGWDQMRQLLLQIYANLVPAKAQGSEVGQ